MLLQPLHTLHTFPSFSTSPKPRKPSINDGCRIKSQKIRRTKVHNTVDSTAKCRGCGYHSQDKKHKMRCKRCLSLKKSSSANVDDYTTFYSNTNTASYEHAMNTLMQHAEVKDENARLLDIGCSGTSSWQIKSCSTQSAHDKSTLHVYPHTIQELIESRTIKKNSMDVIILYHVVYYLNIKQLDRTLKAILSWLKHEGVLLITVMDDDNAFVEHIYKQIAPRYALSTRIQDILKRNKMVQYIYKDNDMSSIYLTFKKHLRLLKCMTIRDCLNQTYFPKGLGQEQLHEVDNKCIHFIKNDLLRLGGEHEEDGAVYENTFKMINFVVKKESKKDEMKRYYAMIGTAIAVFIITLL